MESSGSWHWAGGSGRAAGRGGPSLATSSDKPPGRWSCRECKRVHSPRSGHRLAAHGVGGGRRGLVQTLTLTAIGLSPGAPAQLCLYQYHGILRSGKVSTKPFFLRIPVFADVRSPAFLSPVICFGVRQWLAQVHGPEQTGEASKTADAISLVPVLPITPGRAPSPTQAGLTTLVALRPCAAE